MYGGIAPHQYSFILQNVSDALFVVEVQREEELRFRFVEANSAFYKTYGWTEQQCMGRFLDELFSSPDDAKLERHYRSAAECLENASFEHRAIRPSGEIVFDMTVLPLASGGVCTHLLSLTRDITRQRALESTVKESERKYHTIQEELNRFFRLSLDLLLICSFDGSPLAFNPSWERIFGYDRELLRGMAPLDIVHPEDREATKDVFRTLTAGEPVLHFENRCLDRNGAVRWIRWTANAFLENGTVYATGRDITEQRLQEERLLRSEKLSIVGQLAAGIAHEIRNPLTSLKGFLQLLRSKLGQDKTYEKYLHIMFEEFNRIEDILGEFLVLAKPQLKQMKETNIDRMLRDVVKLLDLQAVLYNVRISVRIEDGLPPLVCDENRLKQVFVNLLKNAIEAMPEGGTAKVAVRRSGSGEVCVRIADKGSGIPEEQMRRLGDPFFTTKENGTGLGIMICQEIVRGHGGRLVFDSKPNKGTAADVFLPFVGSAKAAQPS